MLFRSIFCSNPFARQDGKSDNMFVFLRTNLFAQQDGKYDNMFVFFGYKPVC